MAAAGRKALPWVIPEYCEGCGGCLPACKRGCLDLFATGDEGVYVAWMEDPDRCTGCGQCAEVCVMGGISMTVYQAEAEERFRSFIQAGKLRLPGVNTAPR